MKYEEFVAAVCKDIRGFLSNSVYHYDAKLHRLTKM